MPRILKHVTIPTHPLLGVKDPLDIVGQVDLLRLEAASKLRKTGNSGIGQVFTPAPICRLMASMITAGDERIDILDPGAGVGSLFTATVSELASRPVPPRRVTVTAYEVDINLAEYCADALELCMRRCQDRGIEFAGRIVPGDFLRSAEDVVSPQLFSSAKHPNFNCTILNPPYAKIHSESETRRSLRRMGIETGNLYAAFMYLAITLLRPGGEAVAITPRSFTNGPYFQPFRKWFLRSTTLNRIHVFESRQEAFKDDGVLQENVILHVSKSAQDPRGTIIITSSTGSDDESVVVNQVSAREVVHPSDPSAFIRLLPDKLSERVASMAAALPSRLDDLGLHVSTGRVVDFRARDFLMTESDATSVPLIYPHNLRHGLVCWPNGHKKKASAIQRTTATQDLLVANAVYVVVKRFSSKEERRRMVAAVHDPGQFDVAEIGFENHLNYFHVNGIGVDLNLAQGLSAFLNSTFADLYFRQFSGHTQVNAADLRSMRYPEKTALESLGAKIGHDLPDQDALDDLIQELLAMSDTTRDPVRTKRRIEEALEVLKALGLPSAQQNERSSLTLLSLLNLKPDSAWSEADAPLVGITPMMTFFAEYYGRIYAPNTRETVRRQTVHQFMDAGLVMANPDLPERAINSPKAVYQIEPSLLELLRTYGTVEWEGNLRAYLASVEALVSRYARQRELARIPVSVAPDTTINLSPGGQNVLVEQIIDEFAQRFTPGGRVLYVGDTDDKFAYFDEAALLELGVRIDPHGKMPDVIVHHTTENWLVLVEAVTSHGPVDPKRRRELEKLFSGATSGLVYVTAFLTKKALTEFLGDISWETEVWVAETPDHLIHFNGERFLGPH